MRDRQQLPQDPLSRMLRVLFPNPDDQPAKPARPRGIVGEGVRIGLIASIAIVTGFLVTMALLVGGCAVLFGV